LIIPCLFRYLYQYLAEGNYWDPEYERENQLLDNFVTEYPFLNKEQVYFFIEILTDKSYRWEERFFVADILYLYSDFDTALIEPMLNTAIEYTDPSFTRLFLHPCIPVIGYEYIISTLISKFQAGSFTTRVGIANLSYWVRPDESSLKIQLLQAFLSRCLKTDNIIELYYYKLRLQLPLSEYFDLNEENKEKITAKLSAIATNAEELIASVSNSEEYKNQLKNLGWVSLDATN
jgi:hypothetical protein